MTACLRLSTFRFRLYLNMRQARRYSVTFCLNSFLPRLRQIAGCLPFHVNGIELANCIEYGRWAPLGAQVSSPACLWEQSFAKTRQARTPALPELIQCHCPVSSLHRVDGKADQTTCTNPLVRLALPNESVLSESNSRSALNR